MDSKQLRTSNSWLIGVPLVLIVLSGIQVRSALAQDASAGAEQTIEAKIANALSAGPQAISKEAAVWDWPAEDGGDPAVLRDGTNGWTCFPDFPGTPDNDPMCHDEAFLEWHLAAIGHEEPHLDRVGLSYMLAGGGFVDNAGEIALGPHVMIALPDLSDAAGIPHAEYSGGAQNAPHIFHGGTPLEIIIMPVAAAGETIQVVPEN